MNIKLIFAQIIVVLSVAHAGIVSLDSRPSPFASCSGEATYNVTFFNLLSPRIFGSLIPEDGLVYSPLTATGHSNRVSILTVRGFASKAIEAIAETGDNSMLVETLTSLQDNDQGVKSYSASTGPTLPGKFTTLTIKVNCEHPFISAVSMIAPSPDWIVQVNNYNTFNSRYGGFVPFASGALIAYDAGTDDGSDFTDPSDPSLDLPTEPKLNIAPLVEDDTDRFEGRVVGKYFIYRIA